MINAGAMLCGSLLDQAPDISSNNINHNNNNNNNNKDEQDIDS